MLRKIISLTLTLSFLLQQTVFAYTASLNLSAYLNPGPNLTVSDRFRPVSLRYFSYQPLTNDFKVLLDKGDYAKSSGHQDTKSPEKEDSVLKEAAKELMDYFKIGLSLPNDKFWVNLRPDSEDEIIDEELAKTDLGKVMLEADLKLKQDTALFTSPNTPQGKAYWDKLYKKAGELFGTENITIPTLTRPWIVPGEIILRESNDKSSQGAYIYKANLKVLLEDDYLTSRGERPFAPTYKQYEFNDPRLKELNQYSTQLIRELILPRLTQKVNSSKDYANLRQVYFSLILARWFKETFSSQSTVHSPQNNDSYVKLIDSNNLTNLTSKQAWDKTAYFNAYQKSFQEGEYNLSEPIYTPTGQVIRRYMSGGTTFQGKDMGKPSFTGPRKDMFSSAAEGKPGKILWDGGSFMEQTTGSPLLEEKKYELGAILDTMKNKLVKAKFSDIDYFKNIIEMITSKQDLASLRKSVYEIIFVELEKLSQDAKETIKSELEKLKEFYVNLNADMFAEKLRKEGLTKKLIENAISGKKLTPNPVSFTGLPTDAFTKDKYYLLPASLSIEGAKYRIKVIAGEHKGYYKDRNQNKYMILELVPENGRNTLLPLIELRVYDVDAVTKKYEIRPIINYGGHKAPKKKDGQEEPFYKERQREGFNELFNSEPRKADNYQSVLAVQLIMGVLSASAGAGSALEVKDRLESALEGINIALNQHEYKDKKNAQAIKDAFREMSGYLLQDLKDDKKSLSVLRASLDEIMAKIEESLSFEDRRILSVVSIENKIGVLKLLRESLTPEGIILEALKEQWPFLEGLLSETPSYSEFGIEGGLQIGKGIKCKWVKSSISSRRIELYIYEHISGISEALRISVDKVDKYNPIIVQIADSAVKLAVDNMAIAQSQDLSKDIITIVILSGYKDKIPAEDILTIKNAIKKGGVFQAAKELRKIVLFGAKDYKDIFNYMELALMDEKFYSSKDYCKEVLEVIFKRYKKIFVLEKTGTTQKVKLLDEKDPADIKTQNKFELLDKKDFVEVIEELKTVVAKAEDAGHNELYAFLQNISDDLEEDTPPAFNKDYSDNDVLKASSSMVVSEKAPSRLPVGGIDFRSMNMLVQPVGSFAGLDFSLPALSKAEIESFDLDKELADIRDMVKGGMAPSGRRLKEYLVVCFEKGETRDKIDSLILCLADIFELQQFEARETSQEYKEALVIADTRRYAIKEDRFAVSEKNPYSLN